MTGQFFSQKMRNKPDGDNMPDGDRIHTKYINFYLHVNVQLKMHTHTQLTLTYFTAKKKETSAGVLLKWYKLGSSNNLHVI